MASKVNYLFPVENLNRELDWRLFIACTHVSPANRIFVGQHDVLYRMATRTQMRGGVYLGKHLFRQRPTFKDYERYRAMKALGFLVVHLDEEGAVYEGDEERWRYWLRSAQFDPTCLDAEDYVCTWGTFQRDFYRSIGPACANHIDATGHPRFELYKAAYRQYFQHDVAALTARFGRFILVNTNVGFANNQLGLADTFSARMGYRVELLEERVPVMDRVAHELLLISSIIRAVNRLSVKYPDLNIVLRPHPAEDFDYYRTVFRGISNIHIVHEGPVAPWLLACEMLIHTGCTTAMEAYLADRPIINFSPGIDPDQFLYLTQIFGVKCTTEEQLMQQVDAILNGNHRQRPVAELEARARSLIANFEQDASASVLGVLRAIEKSRNGVPQEWSASRIRRTELGRAVADGLKALVRPLFRERHRKYRALRSHFVQFDRDVIARKVRALEEMLGKRIVVTHYSGELLSIEAAE